MTTKDKSVTIRMPLDLYQWLVDQATKNDRSLNGQMVHLLRQAKAAEAAKGDPNAA